eukprot:TRINITY_DN3295_c3_g1_i1.p2 TRINITY_DN3295_c3_g1~~TRINITY_DN3295_c3_g1_i1.p2  ORF type:complete len:564 (-),score=120.38 TRINITY_DN3295_c3_g1_i1:1686-3377(-)
MTSINSIISEIVDNIISERPFVEDIRLSNYNGKLAQTPPLILLYKRISKIGSVTLNDIQVHRLFCYLIYLYSHINKVGIDIWFDYITPFFLRHHNQTLIVITQFIVMIINDVEIDTSIVTKFSNKFLSQIQRKSIENFNHIFKRLISVNSVYLWNLLVNCINDVNDTVEIFNLLLYFYRQEILTQKIVNEFFVNKLYDTLVAVKSISTVRHYLAFFVPLFCDYTLEMSNKIFHILENIELLLIDHYVLGDDEMNELLKDSMFSMYLVSPKEIIRWFMDIGPHLHDSRDLMDNFLTNLRLHPGILLLNPNREKDRWYEELSMVLNCSSNTNFPFQQQTRNFDNYSGYSSSSSPISPSGFFNNGSTNVNKTLPLPIEHYKEDHDEDIDLHSHEKQKNERENVDKKVESTVESELGLPHLNFIPFDDTNYFRSTSIPLLSNSMKENNNNNGNSNGGYDSSRSLTPLLGVNNVNEECEHINELFAYFQPIDNLNIRSFGRNYTKLVHKSANNENRLAILEEENKFLKEENRSLKEQNSVLSKSHFYLINETDKVFGIPKTLSVSFIR